MIDGISSEHYPNLLLHRRNASSRGWSLAGLLTRPEVAEAKAEANSHEPEAETKICINFFSQILYFDPIFSKQRNLWSISDGTSKVSAQNGL